MLICMGGWTIFIIFWRTFGRSFADRPVHRERELEFSKFFVSAFRYSPHHIGL